jgi:hypothetical protein
MSSLKKHVVKFFPVFIFFYFILSLSSAVGQGVDKVYSVFILNFARTIQWPVEKTTGDFVIGVLNSSKVADELRTVAASKNIGTQKIIVKEYVDGAQVEACHILFLPSLKANLFPAILSKLSGTPTLIITDTEGLATKGGGINFRTIDNKMKFELNSDAIEKRGLRIPSSLKTLGIPVQ